MHKYSLIVVNGAIKLKCNTIVVGNNKEWKQYVNMGSVTNQNFVSIPYSKFINMVKCKCELEGINFITTEESYIYPICYLLVHFCHLLYPIWIPY